MKRKKQPSAEVYREQLRLAADEIIRLRQGSGFIVNNVVNFKEGGTLTSHQMKKVAEEWANKFNGERSRPKPPDPPPSRIEYSSIFGPLFFSSEHDFNLWKSLPWYRRLFRKPT